MSSLRSVTLLGLACAAAGCGANAANSGSAFNTSWQNDSGRSISALEARLRPLPPAPNAALAVAVADDGLHGLSLDGKAHWFHPGQPKSLPFIAGRLVIDAEGDEIVALDGTTGAKVWSTASRGLALRGAASDGTRSALVLANGEHSLFLGISGSGATLCSIDSKATLGVPAARGGVAFVPWSNQYVSAIELSGGEETARLLTREQVSRAMNYGGAIYFGEKGLIRFDEKIRYASTNQATHIGLPPLALPGKPDFLGSGFVSSSAETNARAKIRIYAAPTTDAAGALTLGGGTFAATYFHVVFGLAAASGKLAWVRALPADIVGGAAASSGFALCDTAGKLRLLDSAGTEVGSQDFGVKVRSCVIDTGTEPVTNGARPSPLSAQIGEALDRLEPDMAEAERYLIAELGKLQDPAVTKTLIDLSSSPRIPPELRSETRRLLALRKTGTEYMLAALARHYDFVSGVLLPPPVGPLADALADSGEERAGPLLAKHLNDPANSADDVAHAARALVKLATLREYEDLRTFFSLYRATADDEALVSAVVASAEALLRVGGEPGRAVVEHAADDPLTQADIRRALPALLSKPSAGTDGKASTGRADGAASSKTATENPGQR